MGDDAEAGGGTGDDTDAGSGAGDGSGVTPPSASRDGEGANAALSGAGTRAAISSSEASFFFLFPPVVEVGLLVFFLVVLGEDGSSAAEVVTVRDAARLLEVPTCFRALLTTVVAASGVPGSGVSELAFSDMAWRVSVLGN